MSDPEDDEMDDSEWPDEADQDASDDDSVDTEPCPYCGKPVYEQAEVCPHCGSFLSIEEARNRKPLWIIIGVIIAIAVVVFCWVL